MNVDMIYGNAGIRPEWSVRIMSEGGIGGQMRISGIEVIIIAAIIGILGAIGYGAYGESLRPGFELKKADWRCAASHQETTTTYMDMGGGKSVMLMPITSTSTICDRWDRLR